MLCPECGARSVDGFSHCPWCGHDLQTPALTEQAGRRALTPEEDAFVGPLFRRPPLTIAILLLNVVLYGLMEHYGGSDSPFTLLIFGAKLPGPILEGGQYWRLLSANFLHIGLLHLVLNSLTLVQLGMLCENLFGRVRFFNLYLLSGMGGFFASTLFLDALSAGASASLFGLMGATLVFGARYYREIPLLFRPHFTWYLLPWVVLMLGFGFWYGGIDNLAHLGGLFTGGFCALIMGNHLIPDARPKREVGALLVAALLSLFAVHTSWKAYFAIAPNLELARAVPGSEDVLGQIEVLSRFIDADSSSGLYFFLRARANYLAGHLNAAEADYRDALARRYEVTTVRNELAWTLVRQENPTPGQVEEAVQLAREAVAEQREPAFLNTLGWALYLKGDLDGAQRQLEAAIREGGAGPERAIDHYILAMVLWKKGERENGMAQLKQGDGYFPQRPGDAELANFRAMAQATLDLPNK